MAHWLTAIAWVLITENMVNQPFLDKYCVGYDEKTLPANAPRNAHYKAYILGEGPDGIAKTQKWAAKITSIPAEKNYPVDARSVSKTCLYLSGLGATTTFQRRANVPRYCHAFRSHR
ncbi:hypothetical protein ACLB1S_15835 [Escherichia coli]